MNKIISGGLLGFLTVLTLSITTVQAAPIGLPTVATIAAGPVTATNAALNGTVNPGGGATAAYFQYGTSTHYGSYSSTNNLAATNSVLNVSHLVSGFLAGTVYHFQLVAANSAGTSYGGDQIFANLIAAPLETNTFNYTGRSVDWTVPASGIYRIVASGAQGGLSGGLGALIRGDFSLTQGQRVKIAVGGMGGVTPGSMNYGAGGGGSFGVSFFSGTTNALVVAGGGGGAAYTGGAGDGLTSAGEGFGGGGDSRGGGGGGGFFGNGGGGAYGSGGGAGFTAGLAGGSIGVVSGGTGGFGGGGGGCNGGGSLPGGGGGGGGYTGGNGDLNGGGGGGGSINAGFNQINVGGSQAGNGFVQILVMVLAPAVNTMGASGITAASATLNGTVNPDGADTAAYFQYGTSTNYGSFSSTNNLAATNGILNVSYLLSGLAPGTVYHYRLAAANSAGTNYGSDLTFTNSVSPPVAFSLTGTPLSAGGGFQLNFTNLTGLGFSVLGSTNVAVPLTNWTVLGAPVENPPGRYQFTDPQATNNPTRFYRVRSP